jgi:signal transduction histidine kinase
MMMPGLSGLDVCRELRKVDPDADTRVLLLTARVDEDLKIEALDAGADDFLFKPFSVAEVRARVGNLARTAVLQRALRGANEELRGALRKLGETQAQLLQSEKMNSLGALAAGILHEFKNPLNHALMAVAMARRIGSKAEAKLAGELQETLADAEGALRRIDAIASDLRSFAHPEKGDTVQSFSLGPAVSDAIRFVGAELAGVEVDADLPDLDVACPRTHLVQLLVNLLSNAAAAVRETSHVRAARVSVSGRLVGDRVEVRVRDNGVGIPADRLPRVFEPFYTTKPVGEGTGLGLTVSHAIATRWGSQLTVASEPDAWTEFLFDLPLADPTFAQKASA